MSRKAMKKTLARLGQECVDDINRYVETRDNLRTSSAGVMEIVHRANSAIRTLASFVQALTDAYSEFAEPFDKKLESMEKAVQSIDKPVEKKEKTKKDETKDKSFYT